MAARRKYFEGMTEEEIIEYLTSDTIRGLAKKLGCSNDTVYHLRSQYKVQVYHKDTLCWGCKKACCGCSWSKRFVPVKGWTATETVIIGGKNGNEEIKSYRVIRCPEFEEG